MRDLLTGLGIASLLCLPCLLIGGIAGVAVVGGALTALATDPLLQVGGVVLLATGAALYWRARRRAACVVDGAPEAVDRR
ncbi:MAG: hypothetical protein AB7U23_14965 [Dehalococcoidia bacterium]